MRKTIIYLMVLLCILLLSIWKPDKRVTEVKPNLQPIEQIQQNKTQEQDFAAEEAFAQSFQYYPIDEEIENRMMGVSWKQNDIVEIDDLCYVKVTYWGFDEKPHIGELIVNKDIGQEVIDIFKELYAARFPIEKIRLIDEYNAIDSKSMEDNNTSAFCYREVEGKPGQLSKHSYGIAIDINPVQNPYVYKDKVSPEKGVEYLDRSKMSKGMITADDVVYRAFTSRGWTWGGDWKYEKDYQHFQKSR